MKYTREQRIGTDGYKYTNKPQVSSVFSATSLDALQLRKFRAQKGWSLAVLAEALFPWCTKNKSLNPAALASLRNQISRWETGKREIKPHLIPAFCLAFGIGPSQWNPFGAEENTDVLRENGGFVEINPKWGDYVSKRVDHTFNYQIPERVWDVRACLENEMEGFGLSGPTRVYFKKRRAVHPNGSLTEKEKQLLKALLDKAGLSLYTAFDLEDVSLSPSREL